MAKIQEHGKRADGIVRNMLMHSRGHAGDHQPTNLNSLLAEYIKLGGVKFDDPPKYDLVIDRISHEVPFYRATLKRMALEVG